MSSVKCSHCGLVNFSTSEACKRCGTSLHAEPETVQFTEEHNRYWRAMPESTKAPFFSGIVIVLTGLLIVTAVVCLIQQVGHPFDPQTAKSVAMIFVFAGGVLYFLTHIWLLIRIFEQSIGWGVASLVIPFAILAAVGQYWDRTRRSFVGQLISIGILFVGVGIGM